MRFSLSSGPLADMEPVVGQTPPTTWITVDDDVLPGSVHLRLAVGEDGRLACTGLLVDVPGGELTARDLRRIRLSEILTTFIDEAPNLPELNALLLFLYSGTHATAVGPEDDPHTVMTQMNEVADQQAAHRVSRARPGRRGHPDSHYRQIAEAYRRVKREHPRAPIRALMNELHQSEPTVHRWLRTAVERGYLTKEER